MVRDRLFKLASPPPPLLYPCETKIQHFHHHHAWMSLWDSKFYYRVNETSLINFKKRVICYSMLSDLRLFTSQHGDVDGKINVLETSPTEEPIWIKVNRVFEQWSHWLLDGLTFYYHHQAFILGLITDYTRKMPIIINHVFSLAYDVDLICYKMWYFLPCVLYT
jgi:hypothetical protein